MDSDILSKTDARPARRRPESLAKLKKAARKLFVERGYHATRPQDIAREAGLGHGTFYLHYDDKRACFLAFVEEARIELQQYVDARVAESDGSLEHTIAASLNAIYDYAESHPGVLSAAMTDEAVIDAEGVQALPLLVRWGRDWALHLQRGMDNGTAARIYDAHIIGQAILGVIHQTSSEGHRSGRARRDVIDNVTRFLVRALKPD
jgi:AcrR family transcriptional regulator